MTNLLIRNVPDATVAALETRARAVGLSREEYVRRQLDAIATQTLTAEEIAHSLAALDELGTLASDIATEFPQASADAAIADLRGDQ